jgi:hypothetical protein
MRKICFSLMICVSGCVNCRELSTQVTNLKRWKTQSDETISVLRNDVTSHTATIASHAMTIANQGTTIASHAMRIANNATKLDGLQYGISALQKDIHFLIGNDSLITLREVCYSLEENICHDLFGGTAVEDHSYRFSTLKDKPEQFRQCLEMVESMGLQISMFKTLKKSGDTLVHQDRTPLSAAYLQGLITLRIGSVNSSAFMEALKKYHFIDVAGNVDSFKSPFPNRRGR